MKLIHWDCLEEMDKLIAEWVKVDAIITDPHIEQLLVNEIVLFLLIKCGRD